MEKMEVTGETRPNPLKRSFEAFSSSGSESVIMDVEAAFVSSESQVKACEVAMRENTLAVMETEVGKKIIAVMMIKEIGKFLKDKIVGKNLIAILAPTIRLVLQHHKEIKLHTELDVAGYYGAKGVDKWSATNWDKEINQHDVFVMTPQVLLDALIKGYITLDVFCFIILDECHLATGNHPFANIMKEFYQKTSDRPKIFGMTTSSVIRKGSIKDSKKQIAELENLLDSKVYIVEDEAKLEDASSSPMPICRFYDPVQPLNLKLKEKLKFSWSEFEATLVGAQKSLLTHCKDVEKAQLLNCFSSDFANISSCLENLGIYCACEAIKLCLENVPKVEEELVHCKESIQHYEKFLHEILSIIEGPHEQGKLLDLLNDGSDGTCQISSKLKTLLDTFRLFGKEEVLCIIFIERIFAAKVIEIVMQKSTDFGHFIVSYTTASNSDARRHASEEQIEIPRSSPGAKVNLVFSTDVVEEGVHETRYSHVIQFDLPKSVCNYSQFRGRARQKDSQYIVMLERGNTMQIDRMHYIVRSENSVKHMGTAMNRDPDGDLVNNCTIKEVPAHSVESTVASITANSSGPDSKYCLNLAGDKYFYPLKFGLPPLIHKLVQPPSAAFQTMVAAEACNFQVSKQLISLVERKKLQETGYANDQLVPAIEDSSQNCSISNFEELTAGAGTTKRKELHGTVSISTLSGTWEQKLGGSLFYAYKMDFSCNIPEQKYSSFVLLLEKKLQDCVGNIEVDLFLLSKFAKGSVSLSGQIYLDDQKVAKAKCFQELIFNGLFGKLFVKSTEGRKFLLQSQDSLWDSSRMYLLLPLKLEGSSSEEPANINWMGIESCVSAVEFLKKKALLNFQQPEVTGEISSTHVADPVLPKLDSHVIQLADQSASLDSVKDIVVVSVHTGRIYSILDIIANSSAGSPFDGDVDAGYSSFADYYQMKYGIVLKHPEQPLFLLKQSYHSHNLLVDFRNEAKKKNSVEKPKQHVCMPPELLVGTGIQLDILKTFYLLPSVMHRLESLMLASQLPDKISVHVGNFNISSSLILEALTTLRCNETFSMERLELLGDTVLKYVVSCHLFLKHSKMHEGQLSSNRSRIVSNSNLHKLGTSHKLQEYIRDCAFDPRRWTAPGQRSIWPSSCEHGVDSTEVPYESKFFSEDIKLHIGKTCDQGHRWMISKTISDCVEALIGAYYVGRGLAAAISLMTWLGIETGIERSWIDDAIKVASLYFDALKAEDISTLESKIGYNFSNKGLLLEAITHGTSKQGFGLCYQRLEFLGDAVLDLLITQYFYENYKGMDPGELTSLRSAIVSNDNFALAAVRWNLYPHLQHNSSLLENQISEFVKCVNIISTPVLTPDTIAPKALGDMMESIAGAVLIDSNLSLDEVWRVFKPLLSPIVTPDKLDLPPFCELIALSQTLGYFFIEHYTVNGQVMQAELKLQLEDVLLTGKGTGSTKKGAKGMAALHLLKQLESRGISSSKRRKKDAENVAAGDDICMETELKKQKLVPSEPQQNGDKLTGEGVGHSENVDIPVLPPIDMNKGGPRTSLFSLCKAQQWPMPTFDTTMQESRTRIQIGDTVGFNSFESQISLIIPSSGKLQLTGEARANKKSSLDSAALMMLYELEKLGIILISNCFIRATQTSGNQFALGNVADIPVLPPIDMNRGGPRTSLFSLCKTLHWPMPTFVATEIKQSAPSKLGMPNNFNSFESEISLIIPSYGEIQLIGEATADKKSSFDSAAVKMLYELQRLGKIVINE